MHDAGSERPPRYGVGSYLLASAGEVLRSFAGTQCDRRISVEYRHEADSTCAHAREAGILVRAQTGSIYLVAGRTVHPPLLPASTWDGSMNRDIDDELYARYLDWRSFEDDPDTEPESTRGLDRRASFEEWLAVQIPKG